MKRFPSRLCQPWLNLVLNPLSWLAGEPNRMRGAAGDTETEALR